MPVGPCEAALTADASTAGFLARSGTCHGAGFSTVIAAPGAAGAFFSIAASCSPSAECGGT